MAGRKKAVNGNLALNGRQVLVINATEKQETKKLRVAAYARVSSDSSDQLNSFANQVTYYNTLISGKDGWEMVDVYADPGITGTSAAKRPDFQRMLSDCRKGKIDRILVKSISRFARNTKECLEIVRELKSIGVGVCFEEQNIDTSEVSGELLTAVFAAIAQKESESISQNMRWSYQHRMERGSYLPNSTAFGYKVEGGRVVIDEEKAQIVRQMFQDYLNGANSLEIAARLNQEHILSKNGREENWTSGIILYMLSNERYIGDSLWQKTYCTDALPSKHVRNHGEREQYYAEETHPAIIDRKTFNAVQELKGKRREKGRIKGERHNSPLQRVIRCGNCGAAFTRKVGRGIAYWSCYTHCLSASECDMPRVRENEIKNAFLRMYHKLRSNNAQILLQLQADLRAVHNRRLLWSEKIVSLNQRISDITDENHLLAEMNSMGLVDPDLYIARSNRLAQDLKEAKQERDRLMNADDDRKRENTRDLLEMIESAPEYLDELNQDIFAEMIDKAIIRSEECIEFHLRNGLILTETMKRTVR